MDSAIHWKSYTKRVDIDTAEVITKHEAETNYIKIKTHKYATVNKIRTRGTIEWTILYRRKDRQGTFDFG